MAPSPPFFAVWHPSLLTDSPVRLYMQVYEARRNMVESGEGIDWGMGEALAFGTLLAEGECCRPAGAA